MRKNKKTMKRIIALEKQGQAMNCASFVTNSCIIRTITHRTGIELHKPSIRDREIVLNFLRRGAEFERISVCNFPKSTNVPEFVRETLAAISANVGQNAQIRLNLSKSHRSSER